MATGSLLGPQRADGSDDGRVRTYVGVIAEGAEEAGGIVASAGRVARLVGLREILSGWAHCSSARKVSAFVTGPRAGPLAWLL